MRSFFTSAILAITIAHVLAIGCTTTNTTGSASSEAAELHRNLVATYKATAASEPYLDLVGADDDRLTIALRIDAEGDDISTEADVAHALVSSWAAVAPGWKHSGNGGVRTIYNDQLTVGVTVVKQGEPPCFDVHLLVQDAE